MLDTRAIFKIYIHSFFMYTCIKLFSEVYVNMQYETIHSSFKRICTYVYEQKSSILLIWWMVLIILAIIIC